MDILEGIFTLITYFKQISSLIFFSHFLILRLFTGSLNYYFHPAVWWTCYLHVSHKGMLMFSFHHLAQTNYRLESIFSSDLKNLIFQKQSLGFKHDKFQGVFLWNLPSNIICIVLKGSPGLDYVSLLLNSYFFLSFILEGGCFCSR